MRATILVRALTLLVLVFPLQSNADVLADILDKRVIRVGVAEFVPWTIKTEAGDLIGFEIDVANKIAADMGVRADFRLYEFDKLIPALQQGEIDVIAGGMAITPHRALQVNFTQPLATSGVSLATNMNKTKNISELRHLNAENVVITVVADTLSQSVARTFFGQANLKVYSTADEAVSDLLEDRAHAYVASAPEINFLALMNEGKVDVPISEPIMASSEGLAVRKGEQELLNFLNAWVVARQTDKWLPTTHDYWFRTIDWIPESSR